MTHIIFVDEYRYSLSNGIGTFRKTLFNKLVGRANLRLSLVSLNSPEVDLEIKSRKGFDEYSIPFICGGNWNVGSELIIPIMQQYLPDSPDNVFLLNYSPCDVLIKTLRECYPQSAVVFIVHDQSWCSPLLGSRRNLEKVLRREDSNREILHSVGIEQQIYRLCDKVVCLSESTRDTLEGCYGVAADRIRLIPNGYVPGRRLLRDSARNALGLRSDERVVLFSGRPTVSKGFKPLLMALGRLKRRINVRCVVCGRFDGISDFQKLLQPIATSMIFTGHLDNKELRKWYAAADAGVLSSYTEQCSYAALEMINAGLPIVVSDGNGLCDMFEDGIDALVANIGEVNNPRPYSEELADKIERVLYMDEPSRQKMIKEARKKMSRRYSAERMADDYVSLCIELTGSQRHQFHEST